MKIGDICNLPVKDIADKNAVLFMWVTYPMLSEGLKLIEAWGFKYKTIGFQWIKTNKKNKNTFFLGLGAGLGEYWVLSDCHKRKDRQGEQFYKSANSWANTTS